MAFIGCFFSNVVGSVAVKVIGHGVDAVFFFAPIGKAATFGELIIQVNNVTVEIGVFAFMVIKVAGLFTIR